MPICSHCDGQAAAAITTGVRHRDGSRETIQVACPACHGIGTIPVRRREVARV
ncbi:hypothetical protein [Streptomyces sp. NPDC058371]|uniref:hypothetical protein n=1 Tax=Streptomyces sp. NPDC058371 TaxID=3346463 RepID=UPI0036571B18